MEWIKLHTRGCLRGSIRFDMNSAQRGVWYDLLLLAGESRTRGKIQASEGLAYPLPYIAGLLRVPEKLLSETLAICGSEGRIQMDETGITIVNWSEYQSDYQRKKKPGRPEV